MPGILDYKQSFDGGVNLNEYDDALQPNELASASNVVYDEMGGIAKRFGRLLFANLGASGIRVLSGITFYRGTNPSQFIVHLSDGTVKFSTDGSTWNNVTTGKSTTQRYSFEIYNSKLYMSNGTDNYASWDGSVYTEFASAPKGKFLRVWKDAMWVSGVTGFNDRVYESNAGDAETFGVSSFVDVNKGDGDVINGLHTDGNVLAIFKKFRHGIIYDPVTFANRMVDGDRGTVSHFSCIVHDGVLYFISRAGLAAFL